MKKELFGLGAALLGEAIIERGVRVDIKEHSAGAIEKAREHLAEGSILLAWGPHTSMADPTSITQHFINRELGLHDPERLAWLMSCKFSGEFPTIGSMGIFSDAYSVYARRQGFSTFPVVQKRYFEKLKTDDERERANAINKTASYNASQVLDQSGGLVAVALEGGRFQEGGLQRADASVSAFVINKRNSDFMAVLPLVMRGFESFQGAKAHNFSGIRLGKRVSIVVGDLMSPGDILHRTARHSWQEGLFSDRKEGRFTPADELALILTQYGLAQYKDGVDPRGIYVPENIVTSA